MSRDSIPEKGNCGTTSPGRCTTLQKWRWESGRTFMWGLPPPHPFTDWHTPAVLSSELLRSALMMRHTASGSRSPESAGPLDPNPAISLAGLPLAAELSGASGER